MVPKPKTKLPANKFKSPGRLNNCYFHALHLFDNNMYTSICTYIAINCHIPCSALLQQQSDKDMQTFKFFLCDRGSRQETSKAKKQKLASPNGQPELGAAFLLY